MNTTYFDANIFIYMADARSPYFQQIYELTSHLHNKGIKIITSTETIQEIIHVSKKEKQYKEGLKIAEHTLQAIDAILPVQKDTIKIFLKKNEKYRLNESRDVLHLAVCLENNIDTIITYDNGFKNFTEIKAYNPINYLKYVKTNS